MRSGTPGGLTQFFDRSEVAFNSVGRNWLLSNQDHSCHADPISHGQELGEADAVHPEWRPWRSHGWRVQALTTMSKIIVTAKPPRRTPRKRPVKPEPISRIVTAKSPAKANAWRRYLSATKTVADDNT